MIDRPLAVSFAITALGILSLAGSTIGQGTERWPAESRPQKAHPLSKDHTGIQWVYPFEKALAKAKANGRLLLFLPLAGGTNRAGDW